MWVIAEYEATTLFSLKSSLATSSAGKTLLVPTPFTLKMALLDAAIRTRGLAQGRQDFEWLRDLRVAIRPAEQAVVTNLFAKIQKPKRTDKDSKKAEGVNNEAEPEIEVEDSGGPFGPTIAYREYVHFQGRIGFAFEVQPTLLTGEATQVLSELLLHVNYLGKRGGFFQLVALPFQTNSLPEDFVPLNVENGPIRFNGILQTLDDCGPDLTFDKADIYSDKKVKLGKERLLRSIVVPYRLERSSRSYSLYRRLD
ncbi:MAG TPA: hypothetical protein VH186_24885 [Chloroflexia bacterium]|nr:hypothetical protein [Chloroflexia bacterium]